MRHPPLWADGAGARTRAPSRKAMGSLDGWARASHTTPARSRKGAASTPPEAPLPLPIRHAIPYHMPAGRLTGTSSRPDKKRSSGCPPHTPLRVQTVPQAHASHEEAIAPHAAGSRAVPCLDCHGHGPYSRPSRHTAQAAMPSSRPTKPRRSVVVAFTPMCSTGMPRASAMAMRMAAR